MTVHADDFYSVLSHPIRLRALLLINACEELCVCELTSALHFAQPIISRHLAQLKAAELLISRRQGTWVYYRINPDLPVWMQQIIAITAKGVADHLPYKADRKAIATMQNRPNQSCA